MSGAGRCGTQWATAVLADAGVDVGHQTLRHEHLLGRPWPHLPDVEVSYEAAPVATYCQDTGSRLVALVRDPRDVVASWIGLGAFGDDMWDRFTLWAASIARHCPGVALETSAAARGMAWWSWVYGTWLRDADAWVRPGDGAAVLYAAVTGDDPPPGLADPGPVGTSPAPPEAVTWADGGRWGEQAARIWDRVKERR